MQTLTLSVPQSFDTDAEAVAAFRTAFLAAGGTIGSVPTIAASGFVVDCSGIPPMFFDGWSYRESDNQAVKLFKGVIDIREVAMAQAPSQLKSWTRLDVIQRELKDYEFVGAHVAQELLKPENACFFPEELKKSGGALVFLQKYRSDGRGLGVVCLVWYVGRVCLGYDYAYDGYEFLAARRFAVRRKLSA